MARKTKALDKNNPYKSGDQIHITVTQDYVETATEFFRFCRKFHYNSSDVIRGCMESWLNQTKKMMEQYNQSEHKTEKIINEIVTQYPWLMGSLTILKKHPLDIEDLLE